MDPFLGAVFQKSLDKLIDSISTRIGFIRNYRSNFKKLEEELGELDRRQLEVKLLVEAAENKGEETEKHIEEWQKAATDMIKEVKELVERNEKAKIKCFMNLCPDLMKRYKLSNNAIKKADEVSGFRAKDLTPLSHPRILQGKNYLTTEFMENCESRNTTLNNLIRALEDHVNMIGIYGMGGVGKTTLAKRVGQMVKGQQLFDFVVFVEVKQQPDIGEIQNSIAGMLNLNLQKHGVPARAGELYEMLEKKKKVLVILDNIWKPIDLKGVGIPLADGDKGCHLLLTTRDASVLMQMGCEKQFSIDAFGKEDSWKLFAEIAGSCVQRGDIKSIAEDVADRCGGLPIAIVTVAKALKDKPLYVWEAALREFQQYLEGSLIEKAHSSIQLSYKHLNPNGLKPIFLLCCILYSLLEPSIENLLRYGLVLNIFEPAETMEYQWNNVRKTIQKLADCSLVLELSVDGIFSIHDLVREVGNGTKIIAPAEEYLIVHEILRPSIQSSHAENLTWIFLVDIVKLPDDFNCPKLTFLFLTAKSRTLLPWGFFFGTPRLSVLHLEGLDLPELPWSLILLEKLGALFLKKCILGDTSIIGKLKKLELLVVSGYQYKDVILSESINNLSWLRLLDLRRSSFTLPPNILSKLTLLEELYVDNLNDEEQVEELKDLHRLTALQVLVADSDTNIEVLSKSMVVQNLKRYRICIGINWNYFLLDNSRALHIRSDSDIYCEGVIEQLNGIENLSLMGKCIIKSKTLCEKVFPSLKKLYLDGLVNLEKICHDEVISLQWFCQLRMVYIWRCHNLKNLFPLSIVNQLLVLEVIEVVDCKNISEVFTGDIDRGAENGVIDPISFKKLDSLHLESLPNLTRIFSGLEVTSNASNEGKIEFYSLTNLKLWKNNLKRILTSMIKNIRKLEIGECNNLEYIFSSSTLPSLKNLRDVAIRDCRALKVLVRIDDDSGCFEFSSLESLEIFECPRLKELIGRMDMEGGGNELYVDWPKLKTLKVVRCHPLVDLFPLQKHEDTSHSLSRKQPSSIHHQAFPLLEDLTVNPKQLGMMSWSSAVECKHFFSTLRCLQIQTTANYSSQDPEFLDDGILDKFHFLEKLTIADCLNEVIFSSKVVDMSPQSLAFTNLKILEISKCNEMLSVMSISAVKNLMVLEEMSIRACKKVVEIIANAEDAKNDEITWSKLKTLKFEYLDNLMNFYSGNCIFNLPSLEIIEVHNCRNSEFFSSGTFIMPKLQGVYTSMTC